MERYTSKDVAIKFKHLADAMRYHGVNTDGYYVSHMQGAGWIVENDNATGEASNHTPGAFNPLTRRYLNAREFCIMASGITDALWEIERSHDPASNRGLDAVESRTMPRGDRDSYAAIPVASVRGDMTARRDIIDAWYIDVNGRKAYAVFMDRYGSYTARSLAGRETRHISLASAMAYIASASPLAELAGAK